MYRGLLFLRYSTAEQFNVFNPYTPNIRVIREIRVRFLSSCPCILGCANYRTRISRI